MPEVLLFQGDCREVMADIPDNSIHAIVTDPPYGLEFMGKDWDRLGDVRQIGDATFMEVPTYGAKVRHGGTSAYGVDAAKAAKAQQAWHEAWAREALRVLRPGGYLLAFGGTRTFHRLACAVEDAGFEVRDCLSWLYGQGFPKSRDISKDMDRIAGAEREVIGTKRGVGGDNLNDIVRGAPVRQTTEEGAKGIGAYGPGAKQVPVDVPITAPASPEAKQWAGWGTALKPAWEPIVMARKPFKGTVARNALAHGTGALNIDGARINTTDNLNGGAYSRGDQSGRWPANVALGHHLDCEPVGTETVKGRTINRWNDGSKPFGGGAGHPFTSEYQGDEQVERWECHPDCPVHTLGLASRYFYVAKASKSERNAGLEGREGEVVHDGRKTPISNPYLRATTLRQNTHPTVKPIALMRWLCRLVTAPGGMVLDPFMGSGTTGCAAVLEGYDFVGIELDESYLGIAEARINHWKP